LKESSSSFAARLCQSAFETSAILDQETWHRDGGPDSSIREARSAPRSWPVTLVVQCGFSEEPFAQHLTAVRSVWRFADLPQKSSDRNAPRLPRSFLQALAERNQTSPEAIDSGPPSGAIPAERDYNFNTELTATPPAGRLMHVHPPPNFFE
jgi:hypothetical protein